MFKGHSATGTLFVRHICVYPSHRHTLWRYTDQTLSQLVAQTLFKHVLKLGTYLLLSFLTF